MDYNVSHFLTKRGDHFYYLRRIPAHIRPYDRRPHVRVSLKTKDLNEAHKRAFIQNAAMERYWEILVNQKTIHSDRKVWRDSINIVRAYNFSFKVVGEIAEKSSLEEIIERSNVLKHTKDKMVIKALGGTANLPDLLLSSCLDTYFGLTKDRIIGKSGDFIRKWENPRKRSIKNFIKAVGNKPITELTRSDVNTFRQWWMDKIVSKDMNPGTANKDIVHLKDVLRELVNHINIDIDVSSLFASIKFKNVKSSRIPFEASFVQDQILASGKLNGLNDEAQALVYAMADTGARVNEIVGLLEEDIFLEGKIPFIWIRPNDKRTLKNEPSIRKIPLVGSALFALKRFPKGLSRYDAADSVSNLVNQYFSNNNLKPSSLHTLYSLRHTFKDRLRDVAAPEEVVDELMGHAGHRPDYGRGHTLETKYKWLKKIQFKI